MGNGVFAELEVSGESVCHVADLSETEKLRNVSRSAAASEDEVAVEFTASESSDLGGVAEVFSHEDGTIFRYERSVEESPQCACEVAESHGSPVRHQRAERGAVTLTFVVTDLATLREIIVDLRDQFDSVSLRRLTRSEHPDEGGDLVFVDREMLTDRQREVLETAHEMGYFDHPKRANATAVAEALDINRSTFAEHLAAAQSKLLDVILEQ